MQLFKMKVSSLHDLFIQELKDIYDAEHRIIDVLPKMVDAASTPELKQDFQKYIDVSRRQAARLEQIFDMLDVDPERVTCDGIVGILKEGEKLITAEGDPKVKDAALIAAAQKVEHYEIATYGTLRTWALDMGHNNIADLLQQTLNEKASTDKELTSVAEEGGVNLEARQHI